MYFGIDGDQLALKVHYNQDHNKTCDNATSKHKETVMQRLEIYFKLSTIEKFNVPPLLCMPQDIELYYQQSLPFKSIDHHNKIMYTNIQALAEYNNTHYLYAYRQQIIHHNFV